MEGFEAGRGTYVVAGLRVAVLPICGGAIVHPDVVAVVEEAAVALITAAASGGSTSTSCCLTRDGVAPALPIMWAWLEPLCPDIRELVIDEVAVALDMAGEYSIDVATASDPARKLLNEAVADVGGGVECDPFNAGQLTMGMNITALPSISVPAGLSPRGLPVGLQVVGQRHADGLLLVVAAVLERIRPWLLVAPALGAEHRRHC